MEPSCVCHTFSKITLFDYVFPFLLQVWINQGDIILVGLRDYQDSKADVILKYTPDEARNLKTYGEFPESVRINETVTFVEDGFDEDIEFGDEISSEDDADSVDNI
nr:eukaryotic translation initiation factor 1A, Y-chromosomal-like [Drosophila suzukii]